MKLTGVHFLLSYRCTDECDHCFLWSSPRARGTMTLSQIRDVLGQAKDLGTVEMVYFEGGEPFLFYPIMIQGLREATALGFKTGIVTNNYWATSVEDALEWLRPIAEIGIADLSLSSDLFHGEAMMTQAASNAVEAAKLIHAAGARVAIPCHFWMFPLHDGDPAQFLEACKQHAPDAEALLLSQGELYTVRK